MKLRESLTFDLYLWESFWSCKQVGKQGIKLPPFSPKKPQTMGNIEILKKTYRASKNATRNKHFTNLEFVFLLIYEKDA